MKKAGIIFPNQLFEDHPFRNLDLDIFLVEEFLFFKQFKFHKQKLIYHRATMQFFAMHVIPEANYIDTTDARSDIRELMSWLVKAEYVEIHYINPEDDWLTKRIKNGSDGIKLIKHSNPTFINNEKENYDFIKSKSRKHQTDFYIYQRKKLGILLTQNDKPLGGQWTFDKDNRKKYPKNKTAPIIDWKEKNAYYFEAEKYINLIFPDNPGEGIMNFNLPVNTNEAKNFLTDFLSNRFDEFGPYEDAIVAHENVLHHSLLSPMLNIGLILPEEVLEMILDYSAKNNVDIATVEGIVRQIIGWREFIRLVYSSDGSKQRTTNFWRFSRKIPKPFYTGETGIVPIDITIKKILKTGYAHHIERLMVLGNFMLLCEFDPDEVYRWFMELFIDSYDWVMVPNVYAMSQYADGGLMTTKPYISGSNYLKKMSDYPDGQWQQIWDALFWNFMHKQRKFFLKNPRLGMLIKTFDSWPEDKKNSLLEKAEEYLKSLD